MANEYNVIICGSGSAGLAVATWLARYGIRCKILERRDGPMRNGQADGVQCRTVEIFESLGLVEELKKDAYQVLEATFWSHHDQKHGIARDRRTADTPKGLSHQPHLILNQALVNGVLIDDMHRSNKQVVVYGYEIKDVVVSREQSSDPHAHSVTVVATKAGKEETFKAKYVLGCDGAHSVVRKTLGFKMIGDSTNAVWGVMDVYPRTNFPDIRKKVLIDSRHGTLMIIPREGQSLARFYIQLLAGTNPKEVTLEQLHAHAKAVFSPYTMEIADTYWWSAYSIGQRLADNFHQDYRVFLTGDACHTHSPKAGQGMNVSLQDGYNIGWKLGSVLTGQAKPDLLKTYVFERADTAAKLIEFDRNWTKVFSQLHDEKQNLKPDYLSEQFIRNAKYTAGLTTQYQPSIITSPSKNEADIAKNLVLGMRFPSTQVVRFCDARPMQFARACPSDGRWRLLIFAGDISEHKSAERLGKIADFLDSDTSPMKTSKASHPYIDSFIEPLVILSGDRTRIEQEQIPEFFTPVTGQYKMKDLHKVYCDDESYDGSHGYAYEFYGVDPCIGVLVILRPDQYVAKITTLDDFPGMQDFFGAFAL